MAKLEHRLQRLESSGAQQAPVSLILLTGMGQQDVESTHIRLNSGTVIQRIEREDLTAFKARASELARQQQPGQVTLAVMGGPEILEY